MCALCCCNCLFVYCGSICCCCKKHQHSHAGKEFVKGAQEQTNKLQQQKGSGMRKWIFVCLPAPMMMLPVARKETRRDAHHKLRLMCVCIYVIMYVCICFLMHVCVCARFCAFTLLVLSQWFSGFAYFLLLFCFVNTHICKCLHIYMCAPNNLK